MKVTFIYTWVPLFRYVGLTSEVPGMLGPPLVGPCPGEGVRVLWDHMRKALDLAFAFALG